MRVLEIKEPIKKLLKKLLLDNYQTFIQNPVNEKKKIVLQIDEVYNIKEIIERAIEAITNIVELYTNSGIKTKRE